MENTVKISPIKQIRIEWGLTQSDLAEGLQYLCRGKLTKRQITRWENGRNKPNFDIIVKLAEMANKQPFELEKELESFIEFKKQKQVA